MEGVTTRPSGRLSPARTRRRPTAERRIRAAPGWAGARVLALGHSTRPLEETLELLRSHGVATLADIRTVPRSRRNPQYSQEALRASVERAGIAYVHLKELGGLRKSRRADSPNAAWRNASFRAYADHMLGEEFASGMRKLRDLARKGPVAILCAEGNPTRCHRSLVCDALLARGVEPRHITGRGTAAAHRLTPFARIDGRVVTYPAPAAGKRASRPRR